jgi:leucyl-tRNA synthetase (EC 6.1.1.4)
VLANEQVENGQCWRCGTQVEKKTLKQWFFKITDYADRLEKDLDDVDWSHAIKTMQRNWIGRSSGAEIDFAIDGSDQKLKVFTTRPDTLYGATFMVVAPEHPIVQEITTAEQKDRVGTYIKAAQAKSDVERQETDREKTGRVHRCVRHQSNQRRENPDLGRRLRVVRVWHRRNHGCAGPRRARQRVRPRVQPADPSGYDSGVPRA